MVQMQHPNENRMHMATKWLELIEACMDMTMTQM